MNDPYRVLGVSPGATDEEVKNAYRALAKQYHPDRNNGSPEAEKKMMEVNQAYAQVMEMRKNGTASSWGYDSGYGSSGQAQASAPEFGRVRDELVRQNFRVAVEMLEAMADRGAEWNYLYARARAGLGDSISAMNFARQAVAMDPNNLEYRAFYNQFASPMEQYRARSATAGGVMDFLYRNPCITCLLFNACCGGGCGLGRMFFCC